MKKLKLRKSPSSDRLHNEMLLHLGLEGKIVLLKLINKTWDTSITPSVWKTAIVTHILKKGKPAEDIKSYRPIHRTSCLRKLTIDPTDDLKLTRSLTPTKLDLKKQGNMWKTSCFLLARRPLMDSRRKRTQQQCLLISNKPITGFGERVSSGR
ncbi:RNA directed DNA polymerase from mobile element [Elysia marginata]|uniref:RNA directed DNA polymerase from mobile element n=1 Tax=Elysia marginata TaxID=1093978 RepID=A0AAV4I7R5_9GAST|nr:RNA directed DNA polymerase from mobile element [Elysia marginata]